ncbi:hypothetical protein EJB05_10539, partial [Eragrostis curvula]
MNRNDKKGQTALHMAVKGTNCDVLRALVDAGPAIVMLPDKNGNTALHVTTRKKRAKPGGPVYRLLRLRVVVLPRGRGKDCDDEQEGQGGGGAHRDHLAGNGFFGTPTEKSTRDVRLIGESVPLWVPQWDLGGDSAVHSDSWLLSVAFYIGARFGFDNESRYSELEK